MGPMGLAAVPALTQMAMAAYQLRMARRFERQAGERPVYERPPEVNQALQLARTRSMRTEAPGMNIAREMMRESGASAVNAARQAARTPGDLSRAAVGVAEGQMRGANQMAYQNAQFRDAAEGQYMGALNTAASYSDKEFELNQMAPYMQNMAASSAMRGAGMQNVMGGVNDLFGGASKFAMAKELQGNQMGQPMSAMQGMSQNNNRYTPGMFELQYGQQMMPNRFRQGQNNLDFSTAAFSIR